MRGPGGPTGTLAGIPMDDTATETSPLDALDDPTFAELGVSE